MRALLRRGVERHPLLWAAVLCVAAIAVADGPGAPRWIGTAFLVLFSVSIFLGGRRLFAAAAILAGLCAGLFHAGQLTHQRAALAEAQATRIEATVRVTSPPKIAGRGWSAAAIDSSGAEWWFRGVGLPPQMGETIHAGGHFEPLPATRNPGQFDFRDWAWRKRISGLFIARAPQETVHPPSWLDRRTTAMRQHFSAAIVDGIDPASPEAAVIRAMVLGEVPPDPEIVEPFRTSGTLHAFSVSGMHVAMLGMIGWLILRLCGISRRTSIGLLIVLMAAYVWITGMSPPAVRSLTMAAVVLFGFLLRRRGSLANALGLALLLAVLMDGHLIFQAGVQLSFGVVGAIAFWTDYAKRPFAWMTYAEPYLPKLLYTRVQRANLWARTWLADALGMSTAATAGSIPLLIWHFGLVSPVSIIAGIVMGPVILGLMGLSLLAVTLSFAPPLTRGVNQLNRQFASACIWIARFSSDMPGGHFQVPRDRPADDFLLVYDPGNGAGAAVLHDGSTSVLFDAAQDFSFKNLLTPSLQRLAVTPETLVLSHPESGHIGGAPAALEAFPLKLILLPVEKARSPAYRQLLTDAERKGIPHPLGRAGDRYPLGPNASLEILRVAGPELASATADERVMVTRLTWRGWKILFTADAGWSTEREMLDSGIDLTADIIVMGRNTKDSSGSDAFLDAVHPQAIVASHSDFPGEERIPDRWAANCTARGIRLFHQGETGAVSIIALKDGGLELRGFVDGSSFQLHRP